MSQPRTRQTRTYDANLELKDSGALTSSQACQVESVNKILDLGEGQARGDIVVDVSACEVASDDEKYEIHAQISSQSDFSSDIYSVQCLELGSGGTAEGDNLTGDTDMGTGRYLIPFLNQIKDGVTKRYLRLYCVISGTISTGINFSAYLSKED
jgi:hypothetical protein